MSYQINETKKDRYLRLWFLLAGWYRDVGAITGYNVINEPVTTTDSWFC